MTLLLSNREVQYQLSSIFVKRLDGTEYDLDKLGFRVITFEPPGINYAHTYVQRNKVGQVLTDAVIDKMTIPLTLMIQAEDTIDLELKRLDLKRIFNSDEPFYIYTSRIPYLRWKCVVDGAISYPQIANFWQTTATINLSCPLGLAETVATTADSDFSYESGKWGLGLNIPHGVELKYIFNSNPCRVYNASNVDLRADELPVEITFNGNVKDALTITNSTTNQVFKLSGSYTKQDTIVIDGIVPTINGTEQYSKTNHAYLDFVKGWNDLSVSGATDYTIKFNTRFYY